MVVAGRVVPLTVLTGIVDAGIVVPGRVVVTVVVMVVGTRLPDTTLVEEEAKQRETEAVG